TVPRDTRVGEGRKCAPVALARDAGHENAQLMVRSHTQHVAASQAQNSATSDGLPAASPPSSPVAPACFRLVLPQFDPLDDGYGFDAHGGIGGHCEPAQDLDDA